MAIAGCGGGGHGAKPASNASLGKPVPTNTTTSAAAKAKTRKRSSPMATLGASLTKTLKKAGPSTGALVYDITAGKQLFALRSDIGRPPASVEKLYTTVAALIRMGPNARLTTEVLGAGQLASDGVWHGDLYLRGGGDPTLGDGGFNRVWEQGYGPTASDLVAGLERAGIRRVTGSVIGDGTIFDGLRGGPATAYAADVPDFGGQLSGLTFDHGATSKGLSPAAFAARQLVRTMRGAHIKAHAAKRTAPAPTHARELASVKSPPLSVLVKLMDVPSDDLFAEMLTKQLGVRFGAGGSIDDGARVISDLIGSVGLHPRIVDGSGLSRDNSSSPDQLVTLLRLLWNTRTGRLVDAALPVVGVSGTVQGIAAHTVAQGRCAAKTGTLNYVTNLAGYCTARDHHVLAFALMIDGPANWTAVKMLDRLLPAIARY